MGHCHLTWEAAANTPSFPTHLPPVPNQPYHSNHPMYSSLQGFWHTRSCCPKCAEHPRPSLMRDYSTTPTGSTKVNSRHSEASVTGSTSQHSLPWRTYCWSLLHTWMSIYRDVMLQHTTIWQPSMWHILPWACLTPCRIALVYNSCSG